MEERAERLSDKIHTLTSAQLLEVERFVEALAALERTRAITHAMGQASEPAFEAVWNNPEDDVYDAL